ncbi:UDP-N-acetylmuramyl pentapeptide phosphotransferase/UDP-N-acetylglucosamine-1-phosphate transferase/nucleoside-diphosphate-sugar epimerase [Agromyces sp. 3263]|uniref:NAD-dependent epimerase/dehydratase family protein n=1 Tax=Agromyces sp. 3263 TaxID=2817750 RepID=UPI00285EB785|nr:NAD-dependent epimerase/dehydratase family protein [Agromyces sp. 3263]MDR6904810.1 UDP-N-acetylmuramyl pentapeptide phosphotransferase/UDP-N-acetylglucosamine-1-phosphate transferase/nucleoside-diphosphate-sugar epimerase [Agromyces sp. 3263]
MVIARPSDIAVALVAVIAVGVFLASLVGLAEDVRGLSVLVRAMGQLVVGLVVAVPLGALTGQSWGAVLFFAVAIMSYVNVANFMDGVNGISGLHGAVVGISYSFIGVLTAMPWLTFLGLVISAVFAAFLPWNLTRPGLFLGDVGSYLLGASIASVGVAAIFYGAEPVAVIAPLAVYLADTSFTLFRRLRNGEPVLRSHRMHVYQRLTETGLSHLQVSAIVTLFSIATSIAGGLVLLALVPAWTGLILIGGLCAAFLLLPRFRGHSPEPRPHMALGSLDPPASPLMRPRFRPTRWAIVGASGFVGDALATQLEARGFDVRRIPGPRVRMAPRLDRAEEISDVAVNYPGMAALVTSFQATDVVVNAAGLATPDAPHTYELYGANALVPAIVLHAADRAGVERTIHISSAAVQGNRAVLDETMEVLPFSPYSRSKALGERAFLAAGRATKNSDAIVIRATSVQGHGRSTTETLRTISRSPMASVAGDGSQPTVVSSIDGLVDFVIRVSTSNESLGPVMLQPWEGLSAGDVLRAASGTEPLHLPRWLCRASLFCARQLGRVVPEIAGMTRRLEMMWMGQGQASAFDSTFPAVPRQHIETILARGGVRT